MKKIREEVDYNGDDFLAIINNKNFTDVFTLSQEDKLKKAPTGYEIDHPNIELLKLKSFVAIYNINESEFFKSSITDKLTIAFANIQPFVLFLRQATTL